MNAKRIAVEFPVEQGSTLDLEPCIALFHRFIQEHRLEGLLIDVADYSHLLRGASVQLLGHDVDYRLEQREDGTALVTLRKRCGELSLTDSVRDAVRKALVAVRALQAEIEGLHFRVGAPTFRLFDRLSAPNHDASSEALAKELEPILRAVWGEARLEPVAAARADPRSALALRATTSGAKTVDALLEPLGSAPTAAAAEATAAQSAWDIEAEALKALRNAPGELVLLDVREPHEVEICNLGGTLIPLGTLAQRIGELDPRAHIIAYCKVGGRGAQAVNLLRQAGFANTWNLRGGIDAWIDRVDPSLTRY